ncbi:MAG TPA: TraR/DksA C4-type zinc finger protein [Mycobacteriales bacterium]|jgi:DnaK suppressor protein|nr:TraR/DksA C4-type zinc finger protein [Mycobacteriales bacterium]
MPSRPVPTEVPPDVAPHLPGLYAALLEQRRFRTDQLAGLDAETPTDDAHAEVLVTLRRGARVALADIDAALARLRHGRYGRCVRCDVAIPLERLEILPAVALCMACQRPESGA